MYKCELADAAGVSRQTFYNLDWTLGNIQIVSVAENRKRAVILRARRMVARQDNDPSKDPKNMKPEELLALFNAYNAAGDVYEGE